MSATRVPSRKIIATNVLIRGLTVGANAIQTGIVVHPSRFAIVNSPKTSAKGQD